MFRAVSILFLMISSFCIFGNELINIKKVTYQQGLSENTVMDIAQDSLGYIWVGTREGLNRYDGYLCKNYFATEGKAGSLSSSSIQKIFVDTNSTIWVRTSAGVDVYKPETDSFEELILTIDGEEVNRINDVAEAASIKWLSTPSCVLGLNSKNNNVEVKIGDIKSSNLLCNQGNEKLWISTGERLYLLDAASQKIIDEIDLPFSGQTAEMVWFRDLLWVSSSNGLWIYNGTNWFPFKHLANRWNAEPSNQIERVDEVLITSMVKRDGKLWISTDGNGVFVLDFKNGLSINNIKVNSSETSISTNAVRCLFADMDKNMWIGTVHNGLNLIPYRQKQFNSLKYTGENPGSPNGNFSNFLEDKSNQLWAATFDGLCKLNQNSLTIEKFVAKGTIINTITIDWDGDIFLGTYNKGLLIYNPGTDAIRKVNSENYNLNVSMNALLTDYKGDVWIGANSLYRFNKQTNTLEDIGQGRFNAIISLLEDRNENIWIGTVNGLFLLNPETNEAVRYSPEKGPLYKISSNWVNCLFEDSKGNIWIGTNGGGLNRIQPDTHEITVFNNDETVTSNVVHGIAEDKQGIIWFTTNSGLVCLNPELEEQESYDFTDGLLNSQYIDESMFLSSSGKMFCGGEKGIDFFYPGNIQKNPYPPRVNISGNFIESPTESNFVERENLQRNLNNSDVLTFKYSQSYFGFEFTGIDFANPQKIKYAYQLEGFNTDWIYVNEQRTVNYGHIPPGNYTFKAKAANSDGVWSKPSSVRVLVKPPFSRTPLAFAIYVFILVLVLVVTYRYLLEQKLLKNKLQFESLERKRIEELNQLKLRLFTHISHEFRTPLSLIISPVQELIKRFKTSEKEVKELEIIQNNAQKLQMLVNQVLEVRKIESGAIQMHKSNLDMVPFIKYSCESFYHWAKQKNIELTFEAEIEELILNVDQSLIEKVIYNLLSNAVKFTEKGKVKVHLKVENGFFCFEVIDSGIGISEVNKAKLFEMFYRVEDGNNEVEGSGIGLALSKELVELHNGRLSVESKLNKGSKFKVQLPLPQEKLELAGKGVSSENFDILEKEEGISQNEYTVLLVDDNEELRSFLSDKLGEHFLIIEASNGVQALTMAKQKLPQLIISDVMMPEMDGWELCEQVKTDVEISHIPIILLTALSETDQKIKGLNLGADAYLAKPFNLEHIVSLIRNILRNREQLRRKYKAGTIESVDTNQLTEIDKQLLENARLKTMENLSQPDFSVQMLSEMLGMSRVNLHQKLKALCDLTPSGFIMQVRLKEAVKLLKEKKYQISEIADITGFSTASHFSRVFKKQFEGSPSDFLKGNLKINN